MLRQSSSRHYRSKRLRPRHTFQAFLLFAVGVWIVYQLARSYGKRRAVVVETDDDRGAGEAAVRRRLGRKGLVGSAGHASDDAGVVGVGVEGQDAGWGAASSDDPLSKAEDGDGDEEDQGADEDDGADDADDGLGLLAGDEEDDDRDLLLMSQNGDSEDELKTVLGERDRATLFGNGAGTRLHEPKELNRSAVPRAKAVTVRVQDAAASHQMNTTGAAADGRASAAPLGDSPLKNASSVNQSLLDRGSAGDAATAEKLVANGFAVRAENENHAVSVEDNRVTNRKETADSVAGHGISS